MKELLTLPAGKRWRERELAAWLLGLGTDAERSKKPLQTAKTAQALAVALEKQRVSLNFLFNNNATSGGVAWLISGLVCLCFLVVTLARDGMRGHSWLQLMSGLLLGWAGYYLAVEILLVPVQMQQNARRANLLRVAALAALSRLGQPESVSAAASALNDRSAPVRWAAQKALRALLPILTEAHYGELETQTIPNLCRALNSADDTLVLVVLEALAKIGDGRALKPVQRLAERSQTPAIRDAAQSLLSVLQQREREANAPQILLRAASAVPEAAPEQLLRASLSENPPATE